MSVVKEGFVLEVVQRYESDPGMLIPMMQDLQAEYGYLPPEELKRLAAELGVPLARVYGVAMFYSSFRLAPRGQHEVTLCMGTVCYLKGAPKISEAICAEYGIKPGGTTSDRLFTLNAVNCLGCCAIAPVMVVDDKYHGNLTPEEALKILRTLSEEEPAGEPEAVPAVPEAPVAPAAPAALAAPKAPAKRVAAKKAAPAKAAKKAAPAKAKAKTGTRAGKALPKAVSKSKATRKGKRK